MKLPLADIIIGERQRAELDSDEYPIHELAASIRKTSGAVQPIVVDDTNNLIAGGRRHAAYTMLAHLYPTEGWGLVKVSIRENVSESDRYTMELEENLHRKSLTPEEYHRAIRSYHTELTKNNPEVVHGPQSDPTAPRHTIQDTANALGMQKSHLSQDLKYAELLDYMSEEKRDEIYAKAGGSKAAVHKEIDIMLRRSTRNIEAKERLAEEEAAHKESGADSTQRQEVQLIDAIEGLKSLENHSVDLCITDPPYGVMEGSAGEKGLGHATYDDRNFTDDADETMDLLTCVAPELFRVMRPGSHLYLFCGISHERPVSFHTIAPILSSAGFTVRSMPIVWAKDTQGFKPPFTFWPINAEYIIFATTGKRDLVHDVPRSDVITCKPIGGAAKDHRFQKPMALLDQLIAVSHEPDGTFLDPFCGGGSSLLAARRKWLRVQGFDSDPVAVDTARQKLGVWDAEVLESNGMEQGMEMLQRVKRW